MNQVGTALIGCGKVGDTHAQALAALEGRNYVIPDDVKRLALPVLVHRLIVRPQSALRGYTAARVLTDLLQATPLDIGSLK